MDRHEVPLCTGPHGECTRYDDGDGDCAWCAAWRASARFRHGREQGRHEGYAAALREHEAVVCGPCGGRQQVAHGEDGHDRILLYRVASDDVVTCPTCNGTGAVLRKKEG